MKRLLLAASLLVSTCVGTNAAIIKTYPKNGGVIVTIEGTFVQSDINKFEEAVAPYSKGAVIFASDGGNAWTGEQIGEMIRTKGFSTAVLDGNVCASACALSWLGGVKRYMGTEAKIGFHAVYEKNADGELSEVGSGNALVGAYMSRLGLSDEAIAYITSAPPQGITWLTAQAAEQEGIRLTLLKPEKSDKKTIKPQT